MSLPKTYRLELAVIHHVQQISLFSHLQFTGSFRHIGQIIAPHPTHVLSALLQAQCLHVLVIIASPRLMLIQQ